MSIKRIFFDCDGVLACYGSHFSSILQNLYGNHIPIVGDEIILAWDWEKWLDLSKDQINVGINLLKSNPTCWENLKSLLNEKQWENLISTIGCNPTIDTYFITSRSPTGGVSAAQQTAKWLTKHGWKNPNVIADENKGIICNALQIQYGLDDSGKNCLDIAEKSPNTKIYLLDRPHNQKTNHRNVRRVYSVEEYVEDVIAGK